MSEHRRRCQKRPVRCNLDLPMVLYLIILFITCDLAPFLRMLDTRPSQPYLAACGITWVNPAMETDGASNRPSVRLGNGGLGVNLNGSDPPGAISPEIVG